jgi:mono/diheme cytochrome c family protein
MTRIDLAVRLAAGCTASVLLGAVALAAQQPATPTPGPGLELINERCGYCHTTNQVFAARKTAAEWPAVVQSMIARGAELSPEEQKVMDDYLVATLATDRKPAVAAVQ